MNVFCIIMSTNPPHVFTDSEGDVYIRCAHDGCKTFFAKESPIQDMLEAPLSEENKYPQILAGLLNTKLFCLLHCIDHARTLCRASNISVHNPDVLE